MNAIIGVGQFCEIHGPCLVFCTQTVFKSNDDEQIDEFELDDDNNNSRLSYNCDGCSSIGIEQALISSDNENSAINYISTQNPRNKQLRQYLKQACVRSLSCEIGGNSKSDSGCTMCFCDGDRGGHTVLCYTWRVPDAQARGFHRSLTIVLLIKDRFMLMTVWPFFIKHVEELVKHLQNKAKDVYETEQKNGNNRASRIQSGKAPSCAPRSLAHLSGLPTVWSLLHSRFSWILNSAPKSLQEIPPSKLIMRAETNSCKVLSTTDVSFRDLLNKMSIENFTSLCHCLTNGIQVVFRGDGNEGLLYTQLLSMLLPPAKYPVSYSSTYLLPSECALLSVELSVALPKPSADIFRIDILNQSEWIVKWDANLPDKPSKLVTSIVKAVTNQRINDATLKPHIYSLIIQWQNICKALNMAGSNGINNKVLLRTLGVSDEDLLLVNYWISCLQNVK